MLLLVAGTVRAQLSMDFRTERIFIAPSATDFRPGDSIAVMGQLLATDSLKTPFSKYLYVEIFNRKDSVLLRKKLKTDAQGRFTAKLQASPVWQSDVYYLRAYTKLMQNFSPQSFPVVPLQIGQKVYKPEFNPTMVNCRFFPEGGVLVAGKTQRMVFQLTDYHGFPLSIPYCITAGKDTLDTGQTTASGFRQLQYLPQKGRTVQLHADLHGGTFSFFLPEATDGATLQVAGNSRRLSYQVLASGTQTDTLNLYCFHQDIGLKKLDISGQPSGIIALQGIQPGLITLFLTDTQHRLLAERSHYIQPKAPAARMEWTKTRLRPGEPLNFPQDEADSTRTFVRIYPDEWWCGPHAESALNWTADLTSEVRFPLHYFEADGKVRQMELDNWLATSRFVRFDLKQVLDEGFAYKYPYENALTIGGRVTDRFDKPFKEGTLNVLNADTGGAYVGELDADGKFSLPVGDFGEGDVFFVSCLTGKKREGGHYRYHFEDEVFPAVVNPSPVQKEKAQGDVEVEIGTHPDSEYGVDKNNLLPEVRVKARTKAEEYVPTNRFYKTHFVDVELEDKYHNFADIIADIPVLTLDARKIPQGNGHMKIEYKIFTTRGQNSLGNSQDAGVVILVDGMRITANEAVEFLPFELSTVEYLPPKDAIKVTSGALHGALVIKTRKARISSAKGVKSQGIQYMPMGLANNDMDEAPLPLHAPSQPGKYRILIDRISPQGDARSWEYRVVVE